jgi:hypothetical protein
MCYLQGLVYRCRRCETGKRYPTFFAMKSLKPLPFSPSALHSPLLVSKAVYLSRVSAVALLRVAGDKNGTSSRQIQTKVQTT